MNILENLSDNYKRWADGKLEGFTDKIDDLLVSYTHLTLPTILLV